MYLVAHHASLFLPLNFASPQKKSPLDQFSTRKGEETSPTALTLASSSVTDVVV